MKISFTGLTLDSQDLRPKLCPEWRYPVEWERIFIPNTYIDIEKMAAFANTHLNGRYMFFSAYSDSDDDDDDDGFYSVVLFEHLNDAIMFKMLDGGKDFD